MRSWLENQCERIASVWQHQRGGVVVGWCVSRGGRSFVLERVIGLLLVDFWGAMMVSNLLCLRDCAICGFDSFTFPWRWMWKTSLLPHEDFTPDPDVLVNTGFKFACSPRMFGKQWSNLKSFFRWHFSTDRRSSKNVVNCFNQQILCRWMMSQHHTT